MSEPFFEEVVYSEPTQASNVEYFGLTIFAKILD